MCSPFFSWQKYTDFNSVISITPQWILSTIRFCTRNFLINFLYYQMNWNWWLKATIHIPLPPPPVVYCYVLSFLCYHHISDYKGKLNALCDLELTVMERHFVFPSIVLLKTAKKCLNIAKSLTWYAYIGVF